MAYRVVLSREGKEGLESILAYLQREWPEQVLNKFVEGLDEKIH